MTRAMQSGRVLVLSRARVGCWSASALTDPKSQRTWGSFSHFLTKQEYEVLAKNIHSQFILN